MKPHTPGHTGWTGPTPCANTWGQGDTACWDPHATSSSPLLAGFCAFGVTSAPGSAGLGWCCHLDFGVQKLPRVAVSLPSRAPVAHGFCQGLAAATALPHGAGSCRTMLPRTSSSINTSKRVLMAASKQEGTERQTRLLATGGGEKQLSLQAGEALLPAQL